MELAILVAYGAMLLAIGIYSALKIKNPNDYFVAGKRNGVLQVGGSLLATILGGAAILGSISLTGQQGWAAVWYLLCAALGLLFLLPIVRKISRMGKFTLPELMGRFYGEPARKTASVIIPLAWLGIIAAQIIAAAQVLGSFFGLDYSLGVFISGLVYILYTLIGGQISVLKTDFVQSVIILAGVVVTFFILKERPELEPVPVWDTFPFNVHFSPVDLLILILTFSSTFVVGPDIYSRVFCARNERVSQISVLATALILIPFSFLLAYIGICSFQISPEQEGTSALVQIIRAYLPGWGVGLMVAALLSAVLSSAATTLLTSAIIMSELFHKDIDNRRSYIQTKYFVILIGICSMLIALQVSSVIASLLLALSFYSGAFIVPMAAALFNIPFSRKYSLWAMILGGVISLSGKVSLSFFGFEYGNWIIVAGFAINAAILFLPGERNIASLD
ncbi:MAG: sodium:solute symporter family protein [Prolixibacteraceae bacterium]|jgi:SSS family solute:Na+ symporter|nr:sodium:solute symporter family protein [Prolixibacteraceae bacterium]